MKGLNTRLIHGLDNDTHRESYRSLKTPIYQTASYDFDSSEAIENAFKGKIDAFIYSRISNPTVQDLESRLNILANSQTCLCLSSGMAAISNTILSICDTGDNIVTSKYLFGNTAYSDSC